MMNRIAESVAKSLAVTFLSIVLIPIMTLAQTQVRDDLIKLIEQKGNWNPGDFVVEKLRTHRIVMLGDHGHGVGVYYQPVVSALNSWIDSWEQSSKAKLDNPNPSKLYLILEIDSVRQASLMRYFQTNNRLDFLQPEDFRGNQFTIATLSFFEDLRAAYLRVNRYNRDRAPKDSLSFQVVRPEKTIDFSVWTDEKRDYFFVHERDEYSSAKVRELLERDPKARALIYYGDAHLQRQQVDKLGNGRGFGYYMAHYLTEYFPGRAGVYTCFETVISIYVEDAIKKLGRTIAIDGESFNGVALGSAQDISPLDGTIYIASLPERSKPISRILTQNLVTYAVGHLGSAQEMKKGFYKAILMGLDEYLTQMSANNRQLMNPEDTSSVDSTIRFWKNWVKTDKLDVVESIADLSYFRRVAKLISQSDMRQSWRYQRYLAELVGFEVWFPSDASPQTRAEGIWKNIVKYRKPIVIENLIRTLWFATDSEHEKAVAILKKETGQNLQSAKEWTDWWETQKKK